VEASGFYDVVHRRRDVRAEFTGGVVPAEVLGRILGAAHTAPSVGLSQPWDFLLVRDAATRTAFRDHVQREREVFASQLQGAQASMFARIKIEGILESSLGVVVTYDPQRGCPAVLGRHAIADAGLYSVCLAIQNLWLSATAEGLGVGWVSFYREGFLRDLLGIPAPLRPVAWLCLGPVTELPAIPDLERHGWRTRIPLAEVVHEERFGRPARQLPGAGQPESGRRALRAARYRAAMGEIIDDKKHIRGKLDLSQAVWQRAAGAEELEGPHLEIAFVQDGYVAMRSSEHPVDEETLIFTPAEWEAFVLGAKDGEFDVL
jgi:5,6-dimethylbenzimidazole synthase